MKYNAFKLSLDTVCDRNKCIDGVCLFVDFLGLGMFSVNADRLVFIQLYRVCCQLQDVLLRQQR